MSSQWQWKWHFWERGRGAERSGGVGEGGGGFTTFPVCQKLLEDRNLFSRASWLSVLRVPANTFIHLKSTAADYLRLVIPQPNVTLPLINYGLFGLKMAAPSPIFVNLESEKGGLNTSRSVCARARLILPLAVWCPRYSGPWQWRTRLKVARRSPPECNPDWLASTPQAQSGPSEKARRALADDFMLN